MYQTTFTKYIYRNGILINTFNSQVDFNNDDNENLIIGNWAINDANTFEGYLDDLRIYNRVLSGAEVQKLYDSKDSKYIENGLISGSTDEYFVFKYNPERAVSEQTKYTINFPQDTECDILVVGGAGYVGGGIVDKLEHKHQVTVYDSLIYENEFRKNVNFIYGDIRDYSKLNKILKNYDAVVWLAALVGDGACSINPTLTYEINSESVKNLVSNFKGKIIFFSTCSVYGAQEGVLSEESEVNPLSEYAKSKLVAEDILNNSDAIIFRLGTLFGIGDEFSRIRLDLVVNVLVTKALIDKKMSVFGGEQWRPLLHVKDVANAVDHTIESSLKGVYNLHYKNFRISEIADLIKDKISNVEIVTTPLPFQDARNYQVSSEKFKLASNFEAEVSLEKGIIEVFDLISSGRIKDINNPRYSNHDFLKTFGVN